MQMTTNYLSHLEGDYMNGAKKNDEAELCYTNGFLISFEPVYESGDKAGQPVDNDTYLDGVILDVTLTRPKGEKNLVDEMPLAFFSGKAQKQIGVVRDEHKNRKYIFVDLGNINLSDDRKLDISLLNKGVHYSLDADRNITKSGATPVKLKGLKFLNVHVGKVGEYVLKYEKRNDTTCSIENQIETYLYESGDGLLCDNDSHIITKRGDKEYRNRLSDLDAIEMVNSPVENITAHDRSMFRVLCLHKSYREENITIKYNGSGSEKLIIVRKIINIDKYKEMAMEAVREEEAVSQKMSPSKIQAYKEISHINAQIASAMRR